MTNGEYHAYLLTPARLELKLIDPALAGSHYSFSFLTETGLTYDAQFCGQLSPTGAWQTFTVMTGSGSMVRVTDGGLTNWQRYYRVLAH